MFDTGALKTAGFILCTCSLFIIFKGQSKGTLLNEDVSMMF